MSSVNQNFLDKRYILNSDVDVNAMMSSVTGETSDGTFDALQTEINSNDPNILSLNLTNNHAVFAQNIVKEVSTGQFNKSAQMFLNNIACESNSGKLDIDFLTNVFKTTQGLIEVPIHTILKIGGAYDFYYHNDYVKDSKIDFDVINGLKTKDGYDIFDDPLIKNKHYGTYIFDDKNLTIATAPFVKPLSPKHIDDVVNNGSDLFSKTNVSKNYKQTYYDYNLKTNIPLNNNISSHIPFTGYGVLNNYMNAMSYFFFNEGLDGQTDTNATKLNDNGIPYHIIGNFKGNLKTFKTYNDTQLNFLASYNSYGTAIKHDLNGMVDALNTLTKSITLDQNFVFSKSPKKTEFFLMLSKIKANYLGGHISTDYLFTVIKNLSAINNLKAKQNDIDISDFAALLIHLLFYPDGAEKDSRRTNKTLRILSLYDVDPNSFMPVIEYESNNFLQLEQCVKNILNVSPDKQFEQITRLLLSLWVKEFNQEKSDKLSSLDKDGTYVVYPSCGGDIDIKHLFSNKKYSYNKTNVASTTISTNDLTNTYVKNLQYRGDGKYDYDDINNDLLGSLNFDYKTFYNRVDSNYSDLIDQKSLNTKLKYSQKETIPESITESDKFFLGKYSLMPFNDGLTTLNITAPSVTSKLDRYDDLYIIGNTTDPSAIKELYFDNKSLIYNTSKLFWFTLPNYAPGYTYPKILNFRSKNGENLKEVKVRDFNEYVQYGYGDDVKELYEFGDPLAGELHTYDFSKFKKDTYLYQSNIPVTKSLVDIFGVDKLEDFRSLFKSFSDVTTKNYFTQTFGTFDFQSLIKHTNIFGYKNLPDAITLDRTYNKEEISAFLCGYSGYFIEFASKNNVSKIINYALTVGQENKASIVIDEFMNAKITVNNYSTEGPLYVNNTNNNPEGLRLNSNIFNPTIMYASDTRTADSIVKKIDYRLLFRTLLFGDQPIRAYDLKTTPDNFNDLIEKYLENYVFAGFEPTLRKIVLPELTRTFFSTLNIEFTEGNLQLLITYLRSYIMNIVGENRYDVNKIVFKNGFVYYNNKNATIFPSADGATDKEYDYTVRDFIITNKVVNGVLTKVSEPKYLYNTFADLKAVDKLKEFIDYTNLNILTKQIESFNTGLKKFSELSAAKSGTVNDLKLNKDTSDYDRPELSKSDIELRTGTYYRIKTLYDRSVSFNHIDLNDETLIKKNSKELAKTDVNAILNHPLFFNFNVETDDNDYENCNDKNIVADKDTTDGKLKDLYDYAMVLDRGNNPYGTKVLANIDALKSVIADDLENATKVDNSLRSKSMWSILSKLASDHEFLLMPLTSYLNLNGAVADNQDPFDLAHDMFGVFNNLEMWGSNPAFIFQLGSLTSNVSAGNKSKKNNLSEFDLSNTFCMDIESHQLGTDNRGIILDEGIPNDIVNSNVSSFIVDFGNKNQNMFQNIQLSTDEFANTEESIFTAVNLVSPENVAQLSSGKLFTAMENRSYSCTVTSLGNATIQPLTYFYVKNVPLFYGTYWITNVSHKISPNTMTTTFKGVRQPITKKPTANTTILTQLKLRAQQNAEQVGFVDPNARVQVPTAGRVYTYQARGSVAAGTDNGFGLFSQATVENPDQYINYSGLWITASYLNYMTNGDQTNKLLIKALIAYLYNNASILASSTTPADAVRYFADIVLYDMVAKIGLGDSISNLLSTYSTDSSSEYEKMLLEFAQTKIGADTKNNEVDVFNYLTHDKPLTGLIKTTLITSQTDGVIGNDGTKPKVTYPSDISIPKKYEESSKDDFISTSYWVSDKMPNNAGDLQGFGILSLTSRIFNTKGTAVPKKSGTIKWVYEPFFYNTTASPVSVALGASKDGKVRLNKDLYKAATEVYVEVYSPRNEAGGYPKVGDDGLGEYKKVGEFKNFKNYYARNNRTVDTNGSYKFDLTGLGLTDKRTYFTVARYIGLNPEYEETVNILKTGFAGKIFYSGNNPGADPALISDDFTVPMVLGFGTMTGTTAGPNFVYNESYSNEYTPNRSDELYRADVLGAISNGKSYVSFIGIAKADEKENDKKTRSVRSYIDTVILGTKEKPQPWTVLDPDKDLTFYVSTKKTRSYINGWHDPLKEMKITSGFSAARTINGVTRPHKGVDLRASIGTSVYAALPGKVIFADAKKGSGYGRLVIIAHTDSNVTTLYGHLSATKITAGSTVNAGDIIALSGDEEAPGQPHLHFEVRTGLATSYGDYFDEKTLTPVNPEAYLSYNGASPDVKTVTSAEIEANKVKIKNYLKDRGWSKYEVAAALGNIHKETGNTFNPLIQSGADVTNGKNNVGLIQWNNKTFDTVGSTVDAQMNYLVEGGWKGNTDRFRAQLKAEIPTIKQDLSVAGSNVTGLSSDELQAYVAAYVFAWKVEVCFNCNVGWVKYHITEKGISPSDRSKFAVDYFKRMNNSSDKLKW